MVGEMNPAVEQALWHGLRTERTPATSSPRLFFRTQRSAESQRPLHFTFGVFLNPFSRWDLRPIYGLARTEALPINTCDWLVQADQNKVTLVLWFTGSS